MKVLGLVHQYVPGRCAGAESHIHVLLRALAAQGHHVDVVLSRQQGLPYELDGVHIWPTVDVRRDVHAHLPDADVIVTHLDNTTRASILGHFNDVPVVAVHHNDFDNTLEALVLASSRTDLVAVNSRWMEEALIDWAIIRQIELPPRVLVRPIADLFAYRTVPGRRVTLVNLRRQDGDDPLTKGGELFRELAERMPDVDFLGVEGIYGAQQDLAGLPNVEVLPHVPHDQMVSRVWGRTRILLVPSNYESWGRVASEAMCSGIPVIASPTPGLVEQLDDAGLFARHDDVDAWEAKIRSLQDPDEWRHWSALASCRAGQLDSERNIELARWCEAVEATAALGGRAYDAVGVIR